MIEVRDVTKSFGTQQVLRGVSLDIRRGEAVVIIGRSGGGKSILLKHLIGLLQPDSGIVRVDGEDITAMNERSLLRVRRKYGMLFQMAALFDSLTVEENVGFVLRRQGLESETEIRRRIDEALDMVELPGIGNKMPSELSGGIASGSVWPGRLFTGRRSCSTTSRPPAWTRSPPTTLIASSDGFGKPFTSPVSL